MKCIRDVILNSEIKLNVEDTNCGKMIDRPVYGDRMDVTM